MATRTPTRIVNDANCEVWRWATIDSGDTCEPVNTRWYADKSVQFAKSGAFGGTVTIQGSNDPELTTARYATVNDPAGVAVTSSAEAVKQILEHTVWIKPVAGTGVAAVDILLVLGTTRG